MSEIKNTVSVPQQSAWRTLKTLARLNSQRLVFTFALVAAENILLLTYPLFAGFAINAIVKGDVVQALLYAVVVLAMWGLGAARRSVDTRTFAKIYAELAVPVIMAQRRDNHLHSTIAARVTLSREFVDFFEKHFPVLITSLATIVGAATMLLMLEFWVGLGCLLSLLIFAALLPGFTRKNDLLYERVNNRLEKEVGFVGSASEHLLSRHYAMLARLRVRLSDREALGYLSIGLISALLFALTITLLALKGYQNSGHIYSVMTYLWMFVMSLDDGPQLAEQFSKLRDIGKRVNTGIAPQ